MNNTRVTFMGTMLLLLASSANANAVIERQLQRYQQQGVTQVDREQGRLLWTSTNGDRSCGSCHGQLLQQPGKHVKTGKSIKPMAPSVNPERFQDSKKIEKWFLRNCKWTFGRVCDAQEKSNILAWLNSQ